MKKKLNLRPCVLFAASLALGIALAQVLIYFSADALFALVPSAVSLIACIIYSALKRKFSVSLIFLIAIVLYPAGVLYLYFKYAAYCQPSVPLGELVKVSGRVEEVGLTSAGKQYVIVSRAYAYDTKIDGRIIVYLSENAGDYCRRGYNATFYTTLGLNDYFSDGGISFRVTDNVKYYCSVAGGFEASYSFSLFGEINYAIERTLFENLDGETASVAFAMMTGDTGKISVDTLNSFRFGGVAHVFAVSGLHIGLIYGLVSRIFRKTGANRFASFAVSIAFVALYSGVCGFSPSSVRALIMCAVSGVSLCLYKKYDGLNSLSIAALLLLLINPLYLFDVGFILSFSAMLGISLLSTNIKSVLFFLPEKIKGAVAVGLSAQLATVPALFACFGYVSWAGLLLNLVFIPLISVLYTLLFVVTLLSTFLPFIAIYVLPVAAVPLQFIINLVVTCGFEGAIIGGNVGYGLYLPFIILTFALTDKVNSRGALRVILFFTAALALTILSAMQTVRQDARVTFSAGYGGGAILISTKYGSVFVVSDDYYGNVYYGDADNLVVVGEDGYAAYFTLGGDFKNLYLSGASINLNQIGETTVITSDNFTVCGVEFTYENDCVIAETEGVTVALKLVKKDNWVPNMPQRTHFCLYCFEDGDARLFVGEEQYLLAFTGSLTYNFSNGNYTLSNKIPKG